MNLYLDETKNEPQIVLTALTSYIRQLKREAGPGGWPEINEEIATVEGLRKLLQRQVTP